MTKIIKITSKNHTDVIVFADKIQCVLENQKGCKIFFDNAVSIETGATLEDVYNAIEKLDEGAE